MDEESQSKAFRKTVIVSVLALPLFFIAWFIFGIMIYFGTGGSIVGGHDVPTSGRAPANILLTFITIILYTRFFVQVYKNRLKKQNPRIKNVPTPKKVVFTSIFIPIVAVSSYLGYIWVSEKSNNSPVPNTKEICISREQPNGVNSVSCYPENYPNSE
ncbi:MAG: hypothetical protein V4702_01725 [Patescibacteria group bacterium]